MVDLDLPQPSVATARVLLDSINHDGHRLTTMVVTLARSALAELNTHRAFCLAGDTILEFDLPSAASADQHRSFTMPLADFAQKWLEGAAPRRNKPRRQVDLQNVDPERIYSASDLAKAVGIAKNNLHRYCRTGRLVATREPSGSAPWMVCGSDFIAFWTQEDHNRQDIRERLRKMRIRQVDETTGKVQHSHVNNVIIAGEKEVWTLQLDNGMTVAATREHRIFTEGGWKPLGDLVPGEGVAVLAYGKPEKEHADPNKHKVIDGKWRGVWQRQMAAKFRAEDPLCRRCRKQAATDVAHKVAVHADRSLAFQEDNVTFVCRPCHKEMDRVQGWQGGSHLYRGFAAVESITFRGVEMTYDLEIAGEWPNFFANDIVVHNSRNSASSRAVPAKRMLAAIEHNPFIPRKFSLDRPGMNAGDFVTPEDSRWEQMLAWWLSSRDLAVQQARLGIEMGVHKQDVNRLLEPFMMHTVIISSTEWDNFFGQRCALDDDGNPLAYLPIYDAAVAMRDALAASTPTLRTPFDGEAGWHAPLSGLPQDEGLSPEQLRQVSVARCARVSYFDIDGVKEIEAAAKTPEQDMALFQRLLSPANASAPHLSPFEHVAYPVGRHVRTGNFQGWEQMRQDIEERLAHQAH